MATYNDSAIAQQKTITIKRILPLPTDLAWKAWTDPYTLMQWRGPKGYTCPHCDINLKEGGSYLIDMRDEKGKDVWATGIYEEIIPNQQLVYTDSFADSDGNIVDGSYYDMPGMPMQLRVTVTLDNLDGKTEMLLKHEGIPVEMFDDCVKGWQSSFDKLEAL